MSFENEVYDAFMKEFNLDKIHNCHFPSWMEVDAFLENYIDGAWVFIEDYEIENDIVVQRCNAYDCYFSSHPKRICEGFWVLNNHDITYCSVDFEYCSYAVNCQINNSIRERFIELVTDIPEIIQIDKHWIKSTSQLLVFDSQYFPTSLEYCEKKKKSRLYSVHGRGKKYEERKICRFYGCFDKADDWNKLNEFMNVIFHWELNKKLKTIAFYFPDHIPLELRRSIEKTFMGELSKLKIFVFTKSENT